MGRGGQDTGDEKSKDDQERGKRQKNVEKMREARERSKQNEGNHTRQKGDRAEGKETEKRVR